MQLTTTKLLEKSSGSTVTHTGMMRRFRWGALGTNCELQFVQGNDEQADGFQRAAVAWVEDFEARYSRFRPESELSRINSAAGKHWVEVAPEMERMLDVCAAIYAMTGGLLDATSLPLMRIWNYKGPSPQIPGRSAIEAARCLVGWPKIQRKPGRVYLPEEGMALDFGGWGKEFAVDAVAQIAREHGIAAGMVDFGHDLRTWGAPVDKPAWHVGLEDPLHPGTHRGSVAITGQGMASSGDYLRQFTIGGRRYGHIIDPRNGEPVSNGCTQATVIAPSCLQSGILSTTAFILGPKEGIKFIQDSMGAEGLLLSETSRHQTRGFFHYVVSN